MQIEQLVPVPAVLAPRRFQRPDHQQALLHRGLVHIFRQDDFHLLRTGGPLHGDIPHRRVDFQGVHGVRRDMGDFLPIYLNGVAAFAGSTLSALGIRFHPGIGEGVQIAAHTHKPGAAEQYSRAQQDAPHQGAAFQKPLFPFHAGTLPFLLKLRRIPRQMALAAFTVALPVK